VIVLSLATFLLPTNAGEKILLNLATTVIICITLYFISNRLPAIAYTPPLIGNYLIEQQISKLIIILQLSVVFRVLPGDGDCWIRRVGLGDQNVKGLQQPLTSLYQECAHGLVGQCAFHWKSKRKFLTFVWLRKI
jgi:hypothetical protein